MAELKLNLSLQNLSQFKKKIEKSVSDSVNKVSGVLGIGKQEDGVAKQQQKKVASNIGKTALIAGGILGLLAGVLSSLETITGLIKTSLGFLNRLIAPFLPILLLLLKPFLILFLFVGKFLLKFLRNPAEAFAFLADTLKRFGAAIRGEGEAGATAAARGSLFTIIGGIIGAAFGTLFGGPVGGIVGGLAGAFLGKTLQGLVEPLTEFFIKAEEELGLEFRSFKRIFSGIKLFFGNIFDLIANILEGDFGAAIENLKNILIAAWRVISGVLIAGFDVLFQLLKLAFTAVILPALGDAFQALINGLDKLFDNLPKQIANVFIAFINKFIKFIAKKVFGPVGGVAAKFAPQIRPFEIESIADAIGKAAVRREKSIASIIRGDRISTGPTLTPLARQAIGGPSINITINATTKEGLTAEQISQEVNNNLRRQLAARGSY